MNIFFKKFYEIIFENSQKTEIIAQEYKTVWIELSNKTEDNHFNKRVKNKSRNSYKSEIILKIIKSAIDKFLTDSAYNYFKKNDKADPINFSVISKSYPNVKIKIEIRHNSKQRRAKAVLNGLPPVRFICCLKTILNYNMVDYKKDIELIVEQYKMNKNEFFILID